MVQIQNDQNLTCGMFLFGTNQLSSFVIKKTLHEGLNGPTLKLTCVSTVNFIHILQVSPTELEGLLIKHPAILDAAVTGVPNKCGNDLPRAFVVLKEGFGLSEEDVCEYVAGEVDEILNFSFC